MSTSARTQPIAALLLATVLVAGCDRGPEVPVVQLLEIVSGDRQIAPAGVTLPEPLAVRVMDAGGRPIEGVRVTWIPGDSDNGGFVSSATSPTGTDGIATMQRTMGSEAGEQATTARLESDDFVRFTSIVQVQGATNIQMTPDASGDQQADTVRTTLKQPYRVRVIDQDGAPVAGVIVNWTLDHGSGQLSAEVAATGADGIAEVTLTLGSDAGIVGVVAIVPGLVGSPVSFEATAKPGNPVTMLAYGGDDQVGIVGRQVSPYTAEVADAYGNGIEGVRIDWAVTVGDGAVDPQTSITAASDYDYYYYYYGWDPTPVASTTHLLGDDEGEQTVTASAPELPDLPGATFTSRAVTAIVELDGSSFTPADVTVPAGRTVAWIWVSGRHNVTFEDDPTEPVSSPTKSQGRHLRTFDDPGTFRYRCTIHSTSFTQGMVGTVSVQ